MVDEQGGRKCCYYYLTKMLGPLKKDANNEASFSNGYDFVKDGPYKYPLGDSSKEDDDIGFCKICWVDS